MISGVLVGLSAVLIKFAVPPPARFGVWAGLASAWLVQIAAFALLLAATRRRPTLVVAGWTLGTLLRMAVITAAAWLTLRGVLDLPPEPTLVALVTATFALLLLEPVVFRYRYGTR